MDTNTTNIFKYITTDEEGRHFIHPDKFEALLTDPNITDEKLKTKLRGHQFPAGLKPLLVVPITMKGGGIKTKVYKTAPPANEALPQGNYAGYTHPQKEAIYIHREKFRDKYNADSLSNYHKKMEDEEWRKARAEKQKEYNRKYREKKKLEKASK
jgi:hypothetical protein